MSDILKRLLGTGTPWTSLTYWGLVILLSAPDVLAHFGFDLDGPSKMVGTVLMVAGIRRRLPA